MGDSASRRLAYEKGVRGEALAMEFLAARGAEILAQRYKTKFGEVDIIALDKDQAGGFMLAFVEVKVRETYADGVEAVHYRARRRIEKAALHFMSENEHYAGYGMRFDVIVLSSASPFGGAALGGEAVEFSVDYLDNAWEAGQ